MTKTGKWQNTVLPTVMFFLLYLTAHVFLDAHLAEDPFRRQLTVSLMAGAVLGTINAFIAVKRKNWRYWHEFLIFWGTYIVVQIISLLLIWSYFRYDIPKNSILFGLFYWFPQAAIVMLTIPGAVLYQGIGFTTYLVSCHCRLT